MKNITLVLAALLSVGLTACTSNNQTWDKEGLSFNYPEYMIATTSDFQPYTDIDIYVENKSISSFVEPCALSHAERREENSKDLLEEYMEIMYDIRDRKFNENIDWYDNLACNFAGGNMQTEKIKIDDYNGILHHKAIGQESGSMTVFYTQVLFIDDNDIVHAITFSYDFGEWEKVLDPYRNEYGSAYLSEDYEEADEKWMEVMDYMSENKTIQDEDLKEFENNRKVIESIIESIEFDEEYEGDYSESYLLNF